MALSKIRSDSLEDTAIHGNRNLIINGAMQVHQRGGTTTINDGQSYSLDRFQGFASAGGTYTITQDSDTPSGEGFTNSLKVAVTSADSSLASGDYYVIDQRIEGNVLAQAAFGTSGAKAVTLSFFVRSSVTGSHGGSLSNSAANRSYPYTYTVSSANTWEYKTITIPGDTAGTWLTTTGIGARLYWGLGAGSTASGPAGAWAAAEYRTAASTVAPISTGSATWYITGVQLEVGSEPTPFEHRSFGDELRRCQRYFWRISGYDSAGIQYPAGANVAFSTSAAALTVIYPVPMRGKPTFTADANTICTGVGCYNATGQSLLSTTVLAALLQINTGASSFDPEETNFSYFMGQNSNAFIAFDAEL